MTFEEYEKGAARTALYPDRGHNWPYAALGLVGEAGEIADKLKKVIRDDGNVLTEEKTQELKKELGDVLWYLATLSYELGFTLDEVAKLNLEKLASRKERGALGGSGDNR